MPTISRAGYSALMAYQYAHEDQMGGVDLAGTVVTVAVVRGPSESKTASEVRGLTDAHPGDGDGDSAYSVDTVLVQHSYTDLYAIMYVLPTAVDRDRVNTRVHGSVDVLHNRVRAWYDPMTNEITQKAAELWGAMVATGPIPPDIPRLTRLTRLIGRFDKHPPA